MLKDDLIFLDKEWYVRMFRAKDMINENGESNDTHPGYNSTPVRILTRSRRIEMEKVPPKKSRKGFECDQCDKNLKTMKTYETHQKRYHA